MIKKKDDGCITYRKSTYATRSNPIYITSGGIIPLPQNLSHTTVTILSPTLIRFEGATNEYQTNELPIIKENLPPSTTENRHIFWVLTHSNINTHVGSKWIVDGLKKGNLKAACDGSYKPKMTKKVLLRVG